MKRRARFWRIRERKAGWEFLDGNLISSLSVPDLHVHHVDQRERPGVDLVHGGMETSDCNLIEVKFTKYIDDSFLGIIIFLDNLSIFHLSNAKKESNPL